MIVRFPPVESADPETGLLAVGGDLEVASLVLAYRSGIFPWPVAEQSLLWFAPAKRAILEFDRLHVPGRLHRTLRKTPFEFRYNQNFVSVIRACAACRNRPQGEGTWITAEVLQAYIDLHEAGFAQSFEAYDRKGNLVGGLYGVRIEHFFAGESMFYLQPNASKFALLQTVARLQEDGLTWMDVQQHTPLLASFGAREIPRKLFMRKLQLALRNA